MYRYPIALTQQFKHCGNAFRIDSYKGCDFGCNYCFANNRMGGFKHINDIADFNIIEKYFKKAFDINKESKNITIEMLRHRVPLHLGGMSDPFQKREFKYKVTYKILELTNKYNYPVLMSTKCAFLPDEYFDILNPDIHAFQVSLMGCDEEFIRKFESNTPSPKQRMDFIKLLHDKGFWVGLRLQPLIDINQALKMINEINDYLSFITVEHLKIPYGKKELFDLIDNSKENYKGTTVQYELNKDIKIENINKIKALAKCPVGCGDNDLHYMSDTMNCCGIDTINKNFNQWIKYNSMYIDKTNDYSQWCPKCNCSSCVNSDNRIKGYCFKDYVDRYIKISKEK